MYEASTSLNMYLSTILAKNAAKPASPSNQSMPLIKVVKDGLGIPETGIVFSISPLSNEPERSVVPANGSAREFMVEGDVFIVKAARFGPKLVEDWWRGGSVAAVGGCECTPHEVQRALGCEILAPVLRPNPHLVNMNGFETIFEFLGFDFRSPKLSTAVNAVAYRTLAFNFELWSRTRAEVPLLQVSSRLSCPAAGTQLVEEITDGGIVKLGRRVCVTLADPAVKDATAGLSPGRPALSWIMRIQMHDCL
uniref:Uncharacterized protein n=1 Tax=Mycena chlorophos TaxID=658473 RepID=A0ABQ0L552_MYCCL|nr:predicted protein [Mycena chlorophos]